MVQKPAILIITLLSVAGCWFFFQNYEIEGLNRIRLTQRNGESGWSGPAVSRRDDRLRIASFNIQVFGPTKLGKQHVLETLARVVRQFDIVAIQEIRSRSDDILPRFVDQINQSGRHYDFVIGPRVGRTHSTEQYAFIFDTASVEVDRSQLYTVEDPEDLLHRPPLVAWFRVRGPEDDQAFTFTLVNVHLDPDEAKAEVNLMDDIFRLVRDDGRSEDDVIVMGDFNVDSKSMGELGSMPGAVVVVQDIPTNTRASAQYDNIVLQMPACKEFTGRGSVYDFMRSYNMSLDQALEVSDHLPVWAEFSIYEGGTPGVVGQP